MNEFTRPAQVAAPLRRLPDDARAPFLWPLFAVTREADTRLTWSGVPAAHRGARLRLTCGLDSREQLAVQVRLPDGSSIGQFDLRFPFVHQPFDLRLSAAQAAQATGRGVLLRLTRGDGPAWFFGGDGPPVQVMPQLIHDPPTEPGPSARLDALRQWLRCPASLQAFGWRLGCVLDALTDLGETAAVRSHLAMFFDDQGRLTYEDPHSRPVQDAIDGIETTLPFAHIARCWPEHPSLARCVEFWLGARHTDGNIGGRFVSAEGAYTVAYPMAVIGVRWGRQDLIDLAMTQMQVRRQRLRDGGDIWLRDHGDGRRTFRNWARGTAWYLLGLTRTLVELRGLDRPGITDLQHELRTVAPAVIDRRHESGLWRNFLDDPATAIDTSGSAGIAAALAIASRHRLLDASCRSAAQTAHDALVARLESDGVLGGAAQDNRGGEPLQRGDYRVIHPAGIGLLGQLVAALSSDVAKSTP